MSCRRSKVMCRAVNTQAKEFRRLQERAEALASIRQKRSRTLSGNEHIRILFRSPITFGSLHGIDLICGVSARFLEASKIPSLVVFTGATHHFERLQLISQLA